MLSTSVLSMAAYGHLRGAYAANECGVIAPGGTAICTPAGNSFPMGINYQIVDATVTVQDGVTVGTTINNTNAITSGTFGGNFGNLAITTSGTVAITTTGDFSNGIHVGSADGTIQVTTSAQTSINLSGAASVGIYGFANGANDVTIMSQGTITSSGPGRGVGITAGSGGGNITISGNTITQTGGSALSVGVYAASNGGAGNVDVTMAGVSSTTGSGIIAISIGTGSASVTTTGPVTTYNTSLVAVAYGGSASINAASQVSASSTANNAVFAKGVAGNVSVMTNGVSGGGRSAIYAYVASGTTTVTDTGTVAGIGHGIYAYSGSSSVSVTANNVVATNGDGIAASSGTTSTITVTGNINAGDDGIEVYAGTGVTVVASGTIVAADEGIDITTFAGPTVITANNISTTTAGNDGIAINTPSTFDVTITGAVSGGAGTSAAAGIDIRTGVSGTINIQSGASVGALSGFAITSVATGATIINNNGTINGSLILGAGGTVLNNLSSNSVNLRRFTDTNADGVLDTEAVGLMLFGAGTDTFNNAATGTLRVSTVTGATAFDTANETFATGSAALSLTNAGVEQGHIVGLETFINSGLITLADLETGGTSAVAGDVLAITSLIVPNAGGTSNFISNGGQLHLDTVLNNGVIDTTDVLILDTVTTGTGATSISITNAGGTGSFTGTGATDGIRIVEVRGVGSASDAFSLASPVVGGIFEYELAQTDGQNWYLQSDKLALQIPLYRAVPMALAGFARDQLPWAQKRWGSVEGSVNQNTGAWTRGSYVRAETGFGPSDDFESRARVAQAGYDVDLETELPGALSVGAMLQRSSTDTELQNGNSSSFSAAGWGGALNAFWTPGNGAFAEVLVAANQWDISLDRPGLADVGNTDAWTLVGAIQVGHTFEVTGAGSRWTITPRTAVTYIDSSIDGFTDASGLVVDFTDSDSLLLEAGVISALDLQLEGNRVLSLSAELGVEQQIGGTMGLTTNSVAFSAEREDTRAIVGAGANLHLGDFVSLFARSNLTTAFTGADHTLEANAGVQVKF